MNKKRIAIIVSSFILVIMIIIVTCLLTQCGGGNNAESSKTNTESSVMAQEPSKTNKDESSKTSSKDESSKTNAKDGSSKTTESPKTTSMESSKPTQGGNAGNSGNTGSTGSNDSKPASGGSTIQGCSHNWQPVYTTVHHDAVTHTEQVQTGTKTVEVNPAWDENVEVGEQAYIHFGDGTDWDYDPNNVTEDLYDRISDYMYEHNVGYSVMSRPIYEVVHHEAITREDPVYETQTVTDQAAYDEQVITGYKCSKCGASK